MHHNWWLDHLTPEIQSRIMADIDHHILVVLDETLNSFPEDEWTRERAAIRLLSPLLSSLVVVNGGE